MSTSSEERLAADSAARETALETDRSFIVQAPAGSGKTELLIQRYLRLLASVDEPEEILAITFTRKAAAEMRLRVLDALERAARADEPDAPHLRLTYEAAASVLERDAEAGWNLVSNPRRMRIQTLDSLNASIARMRPLTLTNAGSLVAVAEDSRLDGLYREAAAATLDWLGERGDTADATEEVLLHVDNNTRRYIDYLARMLKTRDQWLPFVSAGLDAPGTATKLRRTLEANLELTVAARLAALERLMPASAADELLHLAAFAGQNLVDAGQPDEPIAKLAGLRALPDSSAGDIDAAVAGWGALADLLLTRTGTLRRQLNKNQGFPPGSDTQKAAMSELLASLADHADLVAAVADVPNLPPVRYTDEQWSVLLALFRVLPVAVAELQRLCLAQGLTDHVEIALSADAALGTAESPGDVALLLDYQVRHILVDEMQDTSKAQYRMLEALTGGWQQGDGRTLFCVGDPMQSIYRFRNAEVSQFLLAREQGIGDIRLEPLVLRRNFRSGERLVEWFNQVFPRVLPNEDDPVNGAVAYAPAVAVEAQQGLGRCEVHPVFGGSIDAEADIALGVVEELTREHPADSIAILVRGRTQLPTLLHKLRAAGIRYQAVDIDRLTDLPEIIDALALARALSHEGDRVAWLALLRSPWVGLDWSDLHRLVANRPKHTVLELLSDERRIAKLSGFGQHAVRHFVAQLERILEPDRSSSLAERTERAWYALGGPGLLLDANAVENVNAFFHVLSTIEQGGLLPDVAAVMDELDAERVSTSVPARLQVMTMHKAKGLQFDHVVLYGLGRYTGTSPRSVLGWFDLPDAHGREAKVISPVGREDDLEHDPIHRFIEKTSQAKDRYEQGRLLYVACTRAVRSLHLVGNTAVAADGDSLRPPHAASLLRLLWPLVETTYEAAFSTAEVHGAGEDDDPFEIPPCARFRSSWQLPAVEAPVATGAAPASIREAVSYDWVGVEARIAGTLVHRWLELAANGQVDLASQPAGERRRSMRRWLLELGATEKHVEASVERVEAAIDGILGDRRGRWLLDGEGHAELALTGLVDGRVESISIDRVRIDTDGTHWIVDYKTSSHEGGDLDAFLRAEADRYRRQLERYARVYRGWSGVEPRCALYFPLLGRFVVVEP